MPGLLSEPEPRALSLRIVLVSPIRLYREGLAAVLLRLDDVAEVYTCEHSVDACAIARRIAPQVLLLDMSSDGSSATARLFNLEFPETKVVALAVPETERHVVACAEAGVVGYVPREGSIPDLIAAIRHAMHGEAVCSPLIAAGLMRRVAMLAGALDRDDSRGRLTVRELEIADYVVRGLSNRAIAARLGIELCTVKNHVHNILEKLGASQRAEVAHFLAR